MIPQFKTISMFFFKKSEWIWTTEIAQGKTRMSQICLKT